MGDIFNWGKRGSGKTADAVWRLLFDWYDGNEIWSNTWLHPAFDTNYKTKEKGNLHTVDAIDLVRMLLDDKDAGYSDKPKTLLLDEIMSQANARNFGSWLNRQMVNFVSQARKRQFNIIYTAQVLGAYDRWLRLMTEEVIRCIPHGYNLCKCHYDSDLGLGNKKYPEPIIFEYIVIKTDDLEMPDPDVITYQIHRETMRNIYPLYKTERIITPVELTQRYAELSA